MILVELCVTYESGVDFTISNLTRMLPSCFCLLICWYDSNWCSFRRTVDRKSLMLVLRLEYLWVV